MRSWHVLIATLALALSLAGCVGGPDSGSEATPIACDLLSSREVSFLATTRELNPFFPITGLLRGSPDEFVVLRIRLSLPEQISVAIDGFLRDETEADVALLQSYAQMKEYWDTPEDLPHRAVQAKADTLQRWYPANLQFTARKGRSEYIVVFKGKNPIPRPATVTLSVALGDAQPQEFTFPLPDKK